MWSILIYVIQKAINRKRKLWKKARQAITRPKKARKHKKSTITFKKYS
jgi:hypothetical protein